jgi:hypothetical protein
MVKNKLDRGLEIVIPLGDEVTASDDVAHRHDICNGMTIPSHHLQDLIHPSRVPSSLDVDKPFDIRQEWLRPEALDGNRELKESAHPADAKGEPRLGGSLDKNSVKVWGGTELRQQN